MAANTEDWVFSDYFFKITILPIPMSSSCGCKLSLCPLMTYMYAERNMWKGQELVNYMIRLFKNLVIDLQSFSNILSKYSLYLIL